MERIRFKYQRGYHTIDESVDGVMVKSWFVDDKKELSEFVEHLNILQEEREWKK